MTLALLDTNTYLRLAKRIRPLLGVEFGQKPYVLRVLKDVEDEVRRNRTLQFKFPWFDDEDFGAERDAAQIRLKAEERTLLDNTQSVMRGHVLSDVDRYTTGGRQPPSDTDCRVLAFGQVREAIVVTDDLGMHLLAEDFEIPIWHGWQLLAKMRTAKVVSNELVREIYRALEANDDLTRSWLEAKHTEFVRIFGPLPK
ncbi:MAG: hypothetical protein JSR92_13510 [Proteobacteria bacterium]|nr:hypothetical protein [Pseudomonadota bacterium]